MTTTTTFPCPNCSTTLESSLLACTSCGLRLVGPQASRLWQVNQQLTALRAESDHLIQALLAPPGPADTSAYAVGPYPAVHRGPQQRQPRAQLSGQQLLLGLGALLLLSAALFFVLVVWFVVGLAGQAAIMVAMTATAVAGSVVATKRRLPAAAETAAVIAAGLLTLDLAAAHWLNLAGLGDLAADAYSTGAGLLGGALLLGFDRLVPRRSDGETLRRVLVYRPAGTVMLAVAGWSATSALDPGDLAIVGLTLVLAAASGAGAFAAYRLDVRVPGLRMPWSALPFVVSAVLALATHALSGLAVGYDTSTPVAEVYAAFALLLVIPVAALVAARTIDLVRVGAIAWLVPVVGIPVIDAPRLALVAAAVVLSVVLTISATDRLVLPRRQWATAVTVVARAAQPVLFLLVLALSEEGAATGRLLMAGTDDAGIAQWWVPVVPAVAWAVPAVVAAVRTRSVLWVGLAETAVLAAAFTALRDSDAVVWWPVALLLVAANLGLAGICARRGAAWGLVELAAIGFGFVWATTAVLAGASESSYQLAIVLVTLGVLTLLYAATPGRLLFSYVGSLAITTGTGVLMAEADVTEIEAYTLPLVALLAAIGWVQWSRDHSLPTFVTMGPALTVAMVPTLLVAVGEGDSPRLLAVTAAGLLILVAGLSRQWQAPVTVGSAVLVVVAVTQGGPLMEYVPGWFILGAAGATLLAVGVAWERAVVAGRRANAWYAALQ